MYLKLLKSSKIKYLRIHSEEDLSQERSYEEIHFSHLDSVWQLPHMLRMVKKVSKDLKHRGVSLLAQQITRIYRDQGAEIVLSVT